MRAVNQLLREAEPSILGILSWTLEAISLDDGGLAPLIIVSLYSCPAGRGEFTLKVQESKRVKRWLVLASVISIAVGSVSTAFGQVKIDTNSYPWHESATGFSHSFFTMKFIGAAAQSRGGDGVAFLDGAKAVLVNPANLFSHNQWEVYVDGEFGGPGNALYFSRPEASLGTICQSIRVNERFTAGLALSRIRDFGHSLRFEEIGYEGPTGRLLYFVSEMELTQLTAAVAFRIYSDLRFGFAVHALNYSLDYRNNQFHVVDISDDQRFLLFQIGLTKQFGDMRLALSLKSGEDYGLKEDLGFTDFGERSVKIPAELGVGAVYRDLVSVDFKYYFIESSYYDDERLMQIGGGLHLPIYRHRDRAMIHLNVGGMYKDNPDFYTLDYDQIFLNVGAEVEIGRAGLYLTLLNGELSKEEEARLTEVVAGLSLRIM